MSNSCIHPQLSSHQPPLSYHSISRIKVRGADQSELGRTTRRACPAFSLLVPDPYQVFSLNDIDHCPRRHMAHLGRITGSAIHTCWPQKWSLATVPDSVLCTLTSGGYPMHGDFQRSGKTLPTCYIVSPSRPMIAASCHPFNYQNALTCYHLCKPRDFHPCNNSSRQTRSHFPSSACPSSFNLLIGSHHQIVSPSQTSHTPLSRLSRFLKQTFSSQLSVSHSPIAPVQLTEALNLLAPAKLVWRPCLFTSSKPSPGQVREIQKLFVKFHQGTYTYHSVQTILVLLCELSLQIEARDRFSIRPFLSIFASWQDHFFHSFSIICSYSAHQRQTQKFGVTNKSI